LELAWCSNAGISTLIYSFYASLAGEKAPRPRNQLTAVSLNQSTLAVDEDGR
jgi:hypothetical protein